MRGCINLFQQSACLPAPFRCIFVAVQQKVLGSSPVRPHHTQSRQVRKEAAVSTEAVRYRSAWPLFYYSLSPLPVALFGAVWSTLRQLLSMVVRALDPVMMIECMRVPFELALAPQVSKGFVQHIAPIRGSAGSSLLHVTIGRSNIRRERFSPPTPLARWMRPSQSVSPPAVSLSSLSCPRRLGPWANQPIHEKRDHHQCDLHRDTRCHN